MTPTWAQALCVAGGSAVGALLRWALGLWLNPLWTGFPLGTLVINLSGGFVIGVAAAWFAHQDDALLRLLLITGLCGGFTTFSAFSLESLGLLQRGSPGMALAHTLAHVLGALACVWVGWWIGQAAWSAAR